jgi:hypothetical protein
VRRQSLPKAWRKAHFGAGLSEATDYSADFLRPGFPAKALRRLFAFRITCAPFWPAVKRDLPYFFMQVPANKGHLRLKDLPQSGEGCGDSLETGILIKKGSSFVQYSTSLRSECSAERRLPHRSPTLGRRRADALNSRRSELRLGKASQRRCPFISSTRFHTFTRASRNISDIICAADQSE